MIIWDEEKNTKLKIERNISFEEISKLILNEQYLDILNHSLRTHQLIFVVELKNYICSVPFVIDEDSNIVLKTAYPSRKLYKKYRGERK